MRWVSTSSNVSSRRRRWSGKAMRSRSPRGSSTPTSRPTRKAPVSSPWLRGKGGMGVFAVFAITLAAVYVIEAFTYPNPIVRIVLRSVPVLPIAIWTLWFDRARPFERQGPAIRQIGRVALLVVAVTFAVAVLGIG